MDSLQELLHQWARATRRIPLSNQCIDRTAYTPGSRHDIVDANKAGEFNIYAIDRIDQALTLLMQKDTGDFVHGDYSEDSILYLAQQKEVSIDEGRALV